MDLSNPRPSQSNLEDWSGRSYCQNIVGKLNTIKFDSYNIYTVWMCSLTWLTKMREKWRKVLNYVSMNSNCQHACRSLSHPKLISLDAKLEVWSRNCLTSFSKHVKDWKANFSTTKVSKARNRQSNISASFFDKKKEVTSS